MPINLPALDRDRTYRPDEVEEFIGIQEGTSDCDLLKGRFPIDLDRWPEHNPCAFRDGEEIFLQYKLFQIAEFKQQIIQSQNDCQKKHFGRQRIDDIKSLLGNGNVAFPVFIQENDPQCRIIEGRHRAVALLELNSSVLPAFLVGYRNWFVEDSPQHDFLREDEIVSTTIHEVFGFFSEIARMDQKGEPLFDRKRFGRCDTFLIAKWRGQITLNSNRYMCAKCFVAKVWAFACVSEHCWR